jgi:hypothetical protein
MRIRAHLIYWQTILVVMAPFVAIDFRGGQSDLVTMCIAGTAIAALTAIVSRRDSFVGTVLLGAFTPSFVWAAWQFHWACEFHARIEKDPTFDAPTFPPVIVAFASFVAILPFHFCVGLCLELLYRSGDSIITRMRWRQVEHRGVETIGVRHVEKE